MIGIDFEGHVVFLEQGDETGGLGGVEGAKLVNGEGEEVGVVTSGTLGPTCGHLVAMGYVASSHTAQGTQLFALVRDKRVPMTVSAMPFAPHRYFRG